MLRLKTYVITVRGFLFEFPELDIFVGTTGNQGLSVSAYVYRPQRACVCLDSLNQGRRSDIKDLDFSVLGSNNDLSAEYEQYVHFTNSN